MENMKLSQYAKQRGVTYRTAWNHFKTGKIPNAEMMQDGHVFINDKKPCKTEKTDVYARVSSSENKTNLKSQSQRVQDFCCAKGLSVNNE